ncbi:protein deadpan-like [Penaeus monodon]|uniref:protein deadpan-like n=1 Tax=Penaeus monodon TaxID=6687 RepID=UPI0018A75F6C|nr:protein deadpan-like [Penaeus monodon]
MLSVLSMMESGHLDGDDEDDHHHDEDDHHDGHPLSKAELRKSNKPIMEKRRRARINTCLNELKSLILDAMKKDPARHSKLEKADILEMTVKHLQAVQRQQLALAVAHDPAVLTKFRGGFAECAQEVTRYVSRIEGVDSGVRQRLLQHLGQCVSGLSAMTPLSFTAMAGLPMPLTHLQGGGLPSSPHPGLQQSPGDVNNNQARLLHSLVAARLAAAGDAAGAAFLLQGGLSLLARAAPHAPPPSSQPPPSAPSQAPPSAPPPPPQPQPVPQPSVVKVNEGASSSGDAPRARPPSPPCVEAPPRRGRRWTSTRALRTRCRPALHKRC